VESSYIENIKLKRREEVKKKNNKEKDNEIATALDQ